MKRGPTSAPSQGLSRHWHIPPPLVHGREPLQGGVVLEEIQGRTGLLLWEVLRDTLLWVEAAPDQREGLFAPGAADRRDGMIAAAPPAPLVVALRALGEIVAAPGTASPTTIADACGAIARWAEGEGAPGTALAFAQSAALLAPTAPAPALAVARLAQRSGDHARAELWYRRATGIARRARAWRVYARSFSGLGTLYRERGNLPSALRFHLRALRGARRGGLRMELAVALHDLFGVAVESGRRDEARRYAREAFEAYPRQSPRLAALAHDVAYVWMEEGEFARAAVAFRRVLPLVRREDERLWVEADLMRAAAGVGDEPLALEMATRVREACHRPELAPAAARALLEIARGEVQLGRWREAEEAAAGALEQARKHREGRVGFAAEALLDSIRSDRTADLESPAPAPRESESDDALAASLVRSLEEFAALAGEDKRTEDSGESKVISLSPAEAGAR